MDLKKMYPDAAYLLSFIERLRFVKALLRYQALTCITKGGESQLEGFNMLYDFISLCRPWEIY